VNVPLVLSCKILVLLKNFSVNATLFQVDLLMACPWSGTPSR
jgi:hypothetical protein